MITRSALKKERPAIEYHHRKMDDLGTQYGLWL